MDLSQLQLRQPLWLLLALLPLLAGVLVMLWHRYRDDTYAEKPLLPWVVLRSGSGWAWQWWRLLLLMLAWLLFAVAMAGPRMATRTWQANPESYTPVMIVFDVSRSMSVADDGLSRVEHGRIEVHDFLRQANNVRPGIMVFAARPHLLSPLTYDRGVLAHYVDLLRPGMLPTDGSGIRSALASAAAQMNAGSDVRAILLVSDGDFEMSAREREALHAQISGYRREGIRLFVLGVGGAEPQPVPDPGSGWLAYQGRPVTTQRRRELLSELATLGGGRYSDARRDNSDWNELYQNGIAQLVEDGVAGVASQDLIIWHELYQWPLVLGLLLFFSAHIRSIRHLPVTTLLVCVLSPGALLPAPAMAEDSTYTTAMRAYAEGDYTTAQQVFATLPGYPARMGEGAAHYQQQQFQLATVAFIQAVLQAATVEERATAVFNLANSYYRLGNYRQAEALYRNVLRYRPDWQAARVNLEYAMAMQRRPVEEVPSAAGRAGRGPGSARVPSGTDVGNGSPSLDDESASATEIPPPPAPDQAVTGTPSSDRAEAVTGDIERFADPQWTYDVDQVEFLPQYLEHLSSDETEIWQRLFEAEEGFPAPLPEPRRLPGVAPW